MRAFKKNILTSNLFLIDFSFISCIPAPVLFFRSFLAEFLYPKIRVVKDQTHIPMFDTHTQTYAI